MVSVIVILYSFSRLTFILKRESVGNKPEIDHWLSTCQLKISSVWTSFFHTVDDDFAALCRPVNNGNGERFDLTDEWDLLSDHGSFQLVRDPQNRSNCQIEKKPCDNHFNRKKNKNKRNKTKQKWETFPAMWSLIWFPYTEHWGRFAWKLTAVRRWMRYTGKLQCEAWRRAPDRGLRLQRSWLSIQEKPAERVRIKRRLNAINGGKIEYKYTERLEIRKVNNK